MDQLCATLYGTLDFDRIEQMALLRRPLERVTQ